ncbi:FAD-binding protein [Chloroflexota bacterium]
MTIERRELSTDVLIIGGGAAGAMAAIKAMNKGAETLVVTKGNFPSGNTSIAAWGYAVALGNADPRDNPQVHFEDAIKTGNGLNDRKLLRTWVTKIVEITREMDSWGNLPLIREDDKLAQRPFDGHTYPRMVHLNNTTGKAVTQCLGSKGKEMGLPVLENTIVGGILKKDGKVVGAWGIQYQTGELLFIRAKAIILATGGLGHLYPITDNVKTITGEGYTLGFRAGAELIGMEFCHFVPTIRYPERMRGRGPVSNLLDNGGAGLYNALGERFIKKYYPDTMEKGRSSEELTRAIGLEIGEGKGTARGTVYLDTSNVPPEVQKELFSEVWDNAARAGVDLNYQPIELSTHPHDHVGGVRIDVTASTAVPGFFAAGEAAGGSHGASRFAGGALADALAFGAIAGESAADYAKQLEKPSPWDEQQLAEVQNRIETLLSTKEGVKPSELQESIQMVAYTYLNAGRNEKGLNKALGELQRLEQQMIPQMSAWAEDQEQRAFRLREAIEVDGQLELSKIIATAALCRQESRGKYYGGHYRSDFPTQDDKNWLKNIILKRELDGAISYRTELPVMED